MQVKNEIFQYLPYNKNKKTKNVSPPKKKLREK